MQVTMTVNGDEVTREIEGRLLLVHFLRDHLGLTGTHWGCDTSNCGTCVVWLDGEPVKSCTVLAAMAGGHEVRTVEGLAQGGELDPVQQGFMQCHGLQCGFCTPGMMMTARALLDRNPDPTEARDPRGHLRPDLPVHRLRDDRPLGPLGRRGRARPQPSEPMPRPARSTRPPSHDHRHERWTRSTTTTRSPSGTAGCCARRTRASSAAAAATSTTSSCPACCTWRSCARRWRTPGSSASTPAPPRRHPRCKASSPARRWPSRAWPGCRRCPTTCRPCWPPTRCASRARRSRSSSPRTATPPATRSS